LSEFKPARVLLGNTSSNDSCYYDIADVIKMAHIPGEDVHGFYNNNNIAVIENEGSVGLAFLPNDYGVGKMDRPFAIWAGCNKTELADALEDLAMQLRGA